MRPSPRVVAALIALTFITACSGVTEVLERAPNHEGPEASTSSPSDTSPPAVERTTDPYRWRARGELLGVRGDRVYVGNGGHVAAFSLSCRSACDPVWRADVDGWPLDIAFYRHLIFVPAGDDGVAVFHDRCEACRPDHRIRFGVFDPNSTYDNARERPPTIFRLGVVDGVLYVISELELGDSSGIQPGRLMAFDAACTTRCDPLWKTPVADGLLHIPTIRDGRVYLPTSDGLFVFQAACRSDGGTCEPLWSAPMNTEAFGMLMAPPSFTGDLVVELTYGYVGGGDADLPQIAAFPIDCRNDGGVCEPLWQHEIIRERFASGPTVYDGRAFVTTAGWNRNGMTFGFPLDCAGSCPPSNVFDAHGAFFRGPIILGNHLVVAAERGPVAYFDASCVGDPCRPIDVWRPGGRVGTIERADEGLLVGVGGRLFVLPSPGTGRWQPRWRWEGQGKIEAVHVVGRIAIVSTHRHVSSVVLPR